MKKTRIYRHGEIVLVPIEILPKGLTKSESKTIVEGSHGNSHNIDNGDLYFEQVDQYVFGYLVAKKTTINHSEHGEIVNGKQTNKAKIANGIYEIRKQQEFINSEMKPVID